MAKTNRIKGIRDLRGKSPKLYAGPGEVCKEVCRAACASIQASLQKAKEDRHSADYKPDHSESVLPKDLGQ